MSESPDTEPRVDRTALSIVSSFEEADAEDDAYWRSRTPAERLEHVIALHPLKQNKRASGRPKDGPEAPFLNLSDQPAMRIPTLIAAFLVVLAACTPPAPQPDASQAPVAATDSATARQRWEARRPAAYAYELEIACLCIHRGRYVVEVRDGQLTAVRDAATGAPSPESRVEWILTPDWLFQAMAQAAQLGTPVRAIYHSELGYPVEAEIGLLADDSGTLYRIENLRPL